MDEYFEIRRIHRIACNRNVSKLCYVVALKWNEIQFRAPFRRPYEHKRANFTRIPRYLRYVPPKSFFFHPPAFLAVPICTPTLRTPTHATHAPHRTSPSFFITDALLLSRGAEHACIISISRCVVPLRSIHARKLTSIKARTYLV